MRRLGWFVALWMVAELVIRWDRRKRAEEFRHHLRMMRDAWSGGQL